MENYYKILEVDRDASPEVIEKAYKALVKKNHPDLKEGLEKKEAEEKIKKINEAYDILSDVVKKEEYDKNLTQTEISSEEYETLLREKETLQQQLSNMKNSTANINNLNYKNDIPTYSNNYDPLKQPVKYYSTTVKNYINKMKQEEDIINDAYQKAYNDAYINELKRRGFKIRYKKHFKDYLRIFVIFLLLVLTFSILWHIPPINSLLKNIYENNPIIKVIVDIISNLITSFFETITNKSLL